MPLDVQLKYTDIVIDLETMSLRPTAAIRSIGAVVFELEPIALKLTSQQLFYQNIDDKFGHVDPDTEIWWSKQVKEAQAVLTWDVVGVQEGVSRLMNFIATWTDPNKVRVWANGAAFDLPIIRNACFTYELPAPVWSYRNDRDTRTLYWLTGGRPVLEFEGTKHNALDDALHEARCIKAAWQKLQNRSVT